MISENMLLLTDNGYKKISEIQKETQVYTYDKKTYNTQVQRQGPLIMYNLCTPCSDNFICDGNNMFLTRRFNPLSQPTWKQILWLDGNDYIGVPINKNSELPKMKKYKKEFELWFQDKKFWDFIGFILKDFKIIGNRIYIKTNRDSKYKLHELKWDYKILKSTNETVITNQALTYFLKFFKEGEHNFIIPKFVIDLPKNILTLLLKYILRDAPNINTQYQVYQHTDKKTIYHLASCVAKLYNTVYLINNNTIANQQETFSLTYSKTIKNNLYGIYADDMLWYKIDLVVKTSKNYIAYKIKTPLDRIIVNGILLSI